MVTRLASTMLAHAGTNSWIDWLVVVWAASVCLQYGLFLPLQ